MFRQTKFRWWLAITQVLLAISLLYFANVENYRNRFSDSPSPTLGKQIYVALNWPAMVYSLPFFSFPDGFRADTVVVFDSRRQPLFLIDVIQLLAISVLWYWIGSKMDGYSPEWWKRRRQNRQKLILSGHILQALLFAFVAVSMAIEAQTDLRVHGYSMSSILLKATCPIIWSIIICVYSSFRVRGILSAAPTVARS